MESRLKARLQKPVLHFQVKNFNECYELNMNYEPHFRKKYFRVINHALGDENNKQILTKYDPTRL